MKLMSQGDQYWYDAVRSEIRSMREWRLGQEGDGPLHAVIISDKRAGYAQGLGEYLGNFADTEAHVYQTSIEWERDLLKNCFSPSFLIFVGLLKQEKTYEAVRRAKELNDRVVSVLMEKPDSLAIEKKERYGIDEFFEIYLPVKLFSDFLKTKYERSLLEE